MVGIIRTSSSYDLLATWRSQTSDLQNRLNTVSQEVATGLKSDVYRSLGFQSSEVLTLRMQMDRNDDYIMSNEMLANKMDYTSATLGSIRNITQDFLDLATPNANSPTQSAASLQQLAASTLEQVTGLLNTTYQNTALFAGVDSGQMPMQKWDSVNATTGLSPNDVLADIIGTGVTDSADATQKAGALKDIFSSTDITNPDRNFEATFFNGSPLKQTDGTQTPRVKSQIDKNTTLSYGIQANDPAFTETLRGLSMIAAFDVSQIDDTAAYEAWMTDAVAAVANGLSGITDAEAQLGAQQKIVDDRISAQQNLGDLFSSRISNLEGVDLYEASSQMLLLENQLQATYTVTSRLSKLSILNYL
jgi:flagellar hook-associated protein 3 FlgL